MWLWLEHLDAVLPDGVHRKKCVQQRVKNVNEVFFGSDVLIAVNDGSLRGMRGRSPTIEREEDGGTIRCIHQKFLLLIIDSHYTINSVFMHR